MDVIAEDVEISWMYGDYEGRLARMSRHVQSENESKLYLLSESESSNTRAVIELVSAPRSKDPPVKFLEIHMEPALSTDWRESVDKEFISDLFQVSAGAVYCAAKMARAVNVGKLKIYGRTEEMRNMFDLMVMDISSATLKIYRQGKWLVIEVE